MKLNIKKIDRDGKPSTEDSKWWQWDSYCDNCGKYIKSITTVIMPDINKNKKDYCDDCLSN